MKPTIKKEIVVTVKGSTKTITVANAIGKVFAMPMKNAKTYLAYVWQNFTAKYDWEAQNDDAVLDAFIEKGKEVLGENGVSSVDALVEKFRKEFSKPEVTTEPATEPATEPSAESSDEPAPSTPPVPPETEDEVESDEENGDSEDDAKQGNKPKSKRKFSTSMLLVVGIISFVIGIAACAIMSRSFPSFTRGNDTDNTDTAIVDASSNADTITYVGSEFLVLDLEKSEIRIQRAAETAVGHNLRLVMNPTVFTDENGCSYLRYTSTTNNVFVEITAPLWAEGSNPKKMPKLDEIQSAERRNQLFGAIEVAWNGNQAVLTLISTGQTYYLSAN